MAGLDSDRSKGGPLPLSRCEGPHRLHPRKLPEILGRGGEVELVSCSIRTAQAQAVQLQDALEVGEQHLDLLPLAT